MITPIEIQSKTFKSGGLGYDKKDVDNFIHEILDSYESLYREKIEMTDRLNTLSEGIQYYKQIEKTLQKALVLAEKTAEETKSTALDRARVIEQEAMAKAADIMADAKNQLENIRKQTVMLVRQYDMCKAKYKSMLQSELQVLDSQSFAIRMDEMSMFEKMNDSIELPTGSFTASVDAGKLPDNPLEEQNLDIEIINLED